MVSLPPPAGAQVSRERNWIGPLAGRTAMVALITLLGLGLRLIRLDAQPLWFDEGYSVFFATRDLSAMLARTAVDIHPPLYYALLQEWLAAMGRFPVTLRLFSVFAGTLTIPVAFRVACQLVSPRVAVLATLLLAISPFLAFYSQEVRMYALLTLCVMVSLALVLAILRRNLACPGAPVSWGLWGGLTTATAAVVLIEYLGAFAVISEIILVLWVRWRSAPQQRFPLRPWFGAWGVAGFLYLPWVAYTAGKLQTYVAGKIAIEQYRPLDPMTFLAQHAAAFSVGHPGAYWLSLGSLFLLVLAVWGARANWRGIRHPAEHSKPEALFSASPVVFLAVTFALAYLLNLVYPFHPPRYERLLLFAAPAFLLLVAQGVVALGRTNHPFQLAVLALLVLLSGIGLYDFYATPRYTDEDYRPLVDLLRDHATAADVILAVYPWQIGYLEAYWPNHAPQVVETPSSEWIENPKQFDQDLAALRAAHRGVWLFAYQKQGRILEDRLMNAFLAQDFLIADEWVGNTRLEYFAPGAISETLERGTLFGEGVTLDYFSIVPRQARAGPDFIRVTFHWDAPPNRYSYSLRLTDTQGRSVLQQDGPIYRDPPVQRIGFFLPVGLPAGEYTLRLVAYHSQDATPLALASGAPGIELARVQVLSGP